MSTGAWCTGVTDRGDNSRRSGAWGPRLLLDEMSNPKRGTNPGPGIRVKVQPKASRNEVVGFQDGILRVKVTAPPEKGTANDTLVGLLSDTFGIAKSRIEILSGGASRDKLVGMGDLSFDDLRRRLERDSAQ